MWCIGLFYPVLLYRDFGFVSWPLFAIPNICGAAFVPWLIKDAKSSEDFIRRHYFASQCFSFVTIVFQFYFMVWAFFSFGPTRSVILISIFICIFLVVTVRKRIFTASFVSFIFSLFALLAISKFGNETIFTIPRETDAGIKELSGLLPVFLIGFFFCPYLDLTFHRVIKECHGSQTRLIFAIAFVVLFFSLLLLGIQYFPMAYHTFLGDNHPPYKFVQLAFYSYVIIQTGFTLIIHTHELSKQKPPRFIWNLLALILICSFIYTIFAKSEVVLVGKSRHLREILYICILSFYGLIAPLYIWIFAILSRHEQKSSKAFFPQWIILFIVTLAVLPLYFVGFFGNLTMIPYVLPIGVVLALVIPFITLRLLVFVDKNFQLQDTRKNNI